MALQRASVDVNHHAVLVREARITVFVMLIDFSHKLELIPPHDDRQAFSPREPAYTHQRLRSGRVTTRNR